jgi:hypothetical protein
VAAAPLRQGGGEGVGRDARCGQVPAALLAQLAQQLARLRRDQGVAMFGDEAATEGRRSSLSSAGNSCGWAEAWALGACEPWTTDSSGRGIRQAPA